MYSAFGVIMSKTRGVEDEFNTLVAGTTTGLLYKCSGNYILWFWKDMSTKKGGPINKSWWNESDGERRV